MNSTDFLQDSVFLKELDNLRIKEQYVRLTILTWREEPIVEIQGKATSGSLNLDGNSSLRRTSNFSMFAEEQENDLTNIDQNLSINRKLKLELGFKNEINPKYGDIVWFPLGIFVIAEVSLSHQNSGVTINISLKDKMCLLNGDLGGVIPAAVTFSQEENEYGEITYPVISKIIYQLVNHFGAEDAAKIIIEDLDDKIKQVMRYNGNKPIFYLQHTVDDTTTRQFYYTYDQAAAAAGAYGVQESDIITYEPGSDIGFILTDFTYPGDLNCDAGATVTSVLDKIISTLGNYEYFYDVKGYFHFQEIKNYLNTTYTTEILNHINGNPNYNVDFSSGKSVYSFQGTKLISSTSNTPNYNNVKNDFLVWGVRKLADGQTQIPVRYHLAIDKKPQIGQTHYVSYYTDDNGIIRAAADFMKQVQVLPPQGKQNTIYVIGYLTSPKYYMYNQIKKEFNEIELSNYTVTTVDWREELYYQGVEALDTGTAQPYYFTQLVNEWPKLFNLKTQKFYDSVRENPSKIDYWLDLIDDNSQVGQYSIQNIGRRSVVVSEDKINCVFEQSIPDLVFIDINLSDQQQQEQINECVARGQDYMQVDQTLFDLFTVGGTQNSCYQRITQLLYQYTNMNETIQLSSMPIYYLEPNTRISVKDNVIGINGDYMIQSISLPLDIDSLMNISAYKCQQKL